MALHRGYENQVCSIASTLELVGERWTLLIVREALLGVHRFDEFQRDLGIARNVLQTRLELLVEHGVLERRRYLERPPRDGYHLTDKGLDLWPVIVALMQWGDVHAATPEGPPVLLTHRDCGGAIDTHRICEQCDARVTAREVLALPGAGTAADHPLRRRTAARAARA